MRFSERGDHGRRGRPVGHAQPALCERCHQRIDVRFLDPLHRHRTVGSPERLEDIGIVRQCRRPHSTTGEPVTADNLNRLSAPRGEHPGADISRHPRVCLRRIFLKFEPSPDLATFARGRIHPGIENDLDPLRPAGQGDPLRAGWQPPPLAHDSLPFGV
jgi:hypothetical protein